MVSPGLGSRVLEAPIGYLVQTILEATIISHHPCNISRLSIFLPNLRNDDQAGRYTCLLIPLSLY